jgi:hypothetical protein
MKLKPLFFVALAVVVLSCRNNVKTEGERSFNSVYEGDYLNRLAFPIGGIGAGMICMEGSGAISHVSVRNYPDVFNEPFMMAALSVKGIENGAKVLEGPVPGWKVFGNPMTGNGAGSTSYGFPRFENASFESRFPFGKLNLQDDDLPVEVTVTGWSPFIPTDADQFKPACWRIRVYFSQYWIERNGGIIFLSFRKPDAD